MSEANPKELPETVYVQVGKDINSDEPWLIACREEMEAVEADLGDRVPGEMVGVYGLVKVVRMEKSVEVREIIVSK